MDEVKKSDAQAISTPVNTQLTLPTPREFNGKLYYGAADVAKILDVSKVAVWKWHNELYMGAPQFQADTRAHDGRYLYEVERVMQLKAVYHPNWTRGGYEPAPFDENQSRIDEAERFFNLLYGKIPPGNFVYLGTKQHDRLIFGDSFKVEDTAAMARRAIAHSDNGVDVWHCVNPVAIEPHDGKRGDKSAVSFQTAIVTDIDIISDAHKSTNLATNFDEAKSFLPFTPSLIIHSGHGLQAYYIFDEPIPITDQNRAQLKLRNKEMLDVIRQRANGKDIDSVDDLPRILRTPNTFNYKLGRVNAPMCHIVEDSGLRFDPADLDQKLDALIAETTSKSARTEKNSDIGTKRETQHSTRAKSLNQPTEQERARAMLEKIPCAQLSYEDWIQVGMILKTNGNDLADWEQWSRADDRYKQGECDNKWQGFSTHGALSIATLHDLAKFYGYSERDFRRDWYQLHPDARPSSRCNIEDDDFPIDSETYAAQIDDTNPASKFLDGLTKDLDMARRLARFTDHKLKYNPDADDWFTYADAGVWQRQPNHSCALPFAAKFADFMTDAAKTFPRDSAERKKSLAIGYYFREKKKVAAAVTLLKACESIFIKAEDLDRHPELLNCLNGVVNLQDGKLYPADPKLLITQQCRADFQPNARSELVEEFFQTIQPDEETRAGLLRWLGYCLTGETSEEKFAVWTGSSGANGKGTLSGTMLELLGPYATGLAQCALLKSNRPADPDRATTSLNALENARFAISEEMPLDGELDTSLVKNLTGGDRINIRRNYGEYRTIRATAKINLSGNFAPKIENVHDGGILRRLINFSFHVQFGTDEHRADPHLKKKLIQPENLRGLLNLLVREAVAWFRRDDGGLIISAQMKAATAQHLSQNDFIEEFISDNYVKVPNATVKAKDLIEDLRREYSRECSRFKRADLIQLIANVDGVTYVNDRFKNRVFKGIGKLATDLGGEPVPDDDIPPFE